MILQCLNVPGHEPGVQPGHLGVGQAQFVGLFQEGLAQGFINAEVLGQLQLGQLVVRRAGRARMPFGAQTLGALREE